MMALTTEITHTHTHNDTHTHTYCTDRRTMLLNSVKCSELQNRDNVVVVTVSLPLVSVTPNGTTGR